MVMPSQGDGRPARTVCGIRRTEVLPALSILMDCCCSFRFGRPAADLVAGLYAGGRAHRQRVLVCKPGNTLEVPSNTRFLWCFVLSRKTSSTKVRNTYLTALIRLADIINLPSTSVMLLT